MFLSRYPKMKSSMSLFSPTGRSHTMQRIMSSCILKIPPLEENNLSNSETNINTEYQSNYKVESSVIKPSNTFNGVSVNEIQLPSSKILPKTIDSNYISILKGNISFCTTEYDLYNTTRIKMLSDISNINLSLIAEFDKNDVIKSALLQMCIKNVSRKQFNFDVKYFINLDYSIGNKDWIYLQYVYKTLISLIKTFPGLSGFNDKLILNIFLPLMSSKEIQERDQLSLFLSLYFVKYPNGFPIFFKEILRKINNHNEGLFDPCFIYTSLQILKNVCNEVPQALNNLLKVFQLQFIPLLRDEYIFIYQVPFLSLLLVVLNSSASMVNVILNSIVSFWPLTEPRKEEIMLRYLYKVLEFYSNPVPRLTMRILGRVGHCCASEKFKIAELACAIISSPVITDIVDPNSYSNMYAIIPHLDMARIHWSSCVREEAEAAYKTISRINPKLTSKCRDTSVINGTIAENWAIIARKASHRDKRMNLAEKLREIKTTIGPPLFSIKNIDQIQAKKRAITKPIVRQVVYK